MNLSQAALARLQEELESTRTELVRDKAESRALLERERRCVSDIKAENTVLKSQIDVLNEEMARLKSKLIDLEVWRKKWLVSRPLNH